MSALPSFIPSTVSVPKIAASLPTFGSGLVSPASVAKSTLFGGKNSSNPNSGIGSVILILNDAG